jgi:RDD family
MAVDSFRAICIKADQLLQRMGRCSDCCFCWPDYSKWTLPPLPTVTPIKDRKKRHQDRKLRKTMACPRRSSHLAIAVQGRCAGTCSRFLALSIDKGLTTGFVFLLVLIIAQLISLVPERKSTSSSSNHTEVQAWNLTDGEITDAEKLFAAVLLPVILVFIIGFVFDALSLAVIGRTVGKIIMGLVVVDSRHGRVSKLSIHQAIIRAFLTNLGFFTVLGTLVSLVRDDRRSIIDLICGTTVIYAWDAKRYRLAEEDLAKDMPFGDLESQSEDVPRRRSSLFARRKRNAIVGDRNKSRVETKLVAVPVFDDDYDI